MIITFQLINSLDTLTYFKLEERTKWEGVFSMFIDSRINYLYQDDIKLDMELVDVLTIEIPKDELNYSKFQN